MSRRQFFKKAKWIRLNALYEWRDSKWVVMCFLIDQEKDAIQKNKELKWRTALLAYFCPFLNVLLYGEKSDNDNPWKWQALGVEGLLWGCQESFCLHLLLWPAAKQVCNFSSWNSIQFKVSYQKREREREKHLSLLNTFWFWQTRLLYFVVHMGSGLHGSHINVLGYSLWN